MILCGHEIAYGQKKEIEIPVINSNPIKASIFCGEKEGKTLVITAGVHGCEYVGIEAAQRLKNIINPKELCGNIILVPIVNESGFFSGAKQVVPEDNQNLNRVFPADENGTLSKLIAHAVQTYLYPYADFLIDLHSGDINEELFPLVFFPIAGEQRVNEKALEAAKCLSVPYRVKSTAKNGLYSYAVQQGIPSLLIERGFGGLWSENEVSACIEDIFRIMSYLNIIDKSYDNINQTEISIAVYEETECNGFWYTNKKAGEEIKQGDLLGVFQTANDKRCIFAEFDGVVLYYTTALGVQKGDALIAYGRA